MIKVAASILAADFLKLGDEIGRAADAGADWLHFDVMDGMFVPNISFGPAILEAAVRSGRLPCDVHLMIESPERYVETFARAGARVITIHAEATRHLNRALHLIRECGCLAGVSMNPATPPDVLRYVLGDFDLALVMTVNPGFGGQKLIPAAASKVGVINRMLTEAGVTAEIEVDGGVDLVTAPKLVRHGATVLVAGSALFGAPNAADFVEGLKKLGQAQL
jgi:ribulose-phosphate 3-epimerase